MKQLYWIEDVNGNPLISQGTELRVIASSWEEAKEILNKLGIPAQDVQFWTSCAGKPYCSSCD